jgi:hypothetical protein
MIATNNGNNSMECTIRYMVWFNHELACNTDSLITRLGLIDAFPLCIF